MDCIYIKNRMIGEGQPCFIIAEAGVNHNGSLQRAYQLVDAALAAGADAVKFQTFRAAALVDDAVRKAPYQAEQTEKDESQLDMLKKLELSAADFAKLAAYCADKGILFLSTPFDTDSVDLLDDLDVPLFKVGSGEITNLPFLSYIGAKGRPVILSTGMADEKEVDVSVACLRDAGCESLVLLHCVSNYPADPSTVNLRVMATMKKRYNVPVGFSDHTRGIEIAIGAAALGACVIEKHLTLSRQDPGPDHAASLEPLEFRALVYAVRNVEKALGDGVKRTVVSEVEVAQVARRSLFAAQDIVEGDVADETSFVVKRPGTGLSPARIGGLRGRIFACAVRAGEMIREDMFVDR